MRNTRQCPVSPAEGAILFGDFDPAAHGPAQDNRNSRRHERPERDRAAERGREQGSDQFTDINRSILTGR